MDIRILLAAALLAGLAACTASDEVLTGIDVLERDGFGPLSGQRIGLITNHTGLTRDGRGTIRVLHNAPDVELVRIFSPEHGIAGKLDIPKIDDGTDSTTGIAIASLYGEVRRPTADMLEDLDTLVFDIQDIGTRYYTYISTMGEAMIAASEHGKRFVVLDRPNPINGVDVEGPLLDDGKQSFVGFHTLPIRHGMTTGELALMFRGELGLDLDLEVIRVDGWKRSEFFDDTGLTWINPSPNMRSLRAALLYPGIGLLETTNISVGRGTATPFELFGAPWLDGEQLASSLNRLALPGIEFAPVEFTPDASVFADERCEGVRITIIDRHELEPVQVGLEVARILVSDYSDAWKTERYIRLLGNDAVLEALLAGDGIEEITAAYANALATFRERRSAFLLYD